MASLGKVSQPKDLEYFVKAMCRTCLLLITFQSNKEPLKDVLMGIPKRDLLGMTVAVL